MIDDNILKKRVEEKVNIIEFLGHVVYLATSDNMMLKLGANALNRENSIDFTITAVVNGVVVDFVNSVDLSKLGDSHCCIFHEALDYIEALKEAIINLTETMTENKVLN